MISKGLMEEVTFHLMFHYLLSIILYYAYVIKSFTTSCFYI